MGKTKKLTYDEEVTYDDLLYMVKRLERQNKILTKELEQRPFKIKRIIKKVYINNDPIIKELKMSMIKRDTKWVY